MPSRVVGVTAAVVAALSAASTHPVQAAAAPSEAVAAARPNDEREAAPRAIKVVNDFIAKGTLSVWNKKVGDFVEQDEVVATIETDKVDVPVNSPYTGTIVELYVKEEDTVVVDQDLFKIETGTKAEIGDVVP